MPFNHFILCHPLLLLPSIFPRIRVFSHESGLHIRWPKYWHFSFSISTSSEYSWLISFQFSSMAQTCPTLAIPWTAACQASLSITNSQSLLKFMFTESSVMPSNHLILCRPLLLPPSIFPSTRVFSNESAVCLRWSKYWSLSSASVLPMNIQDWFPLGLTGLVSLQSSGLSRVFSSTAVQRHQFFSAQHFKIGLWECSV